MSWDNTRAIQREACDIIRPATNFHADLIRLALTRPARHHVEPEEMISVITLTTDHEV